MLHEILRPVGRRKPRQEDTMKTNPSTILATVALLGTAGAAFPVAAQKAVAPPQSETRVDGAQGGRDFAPVPAPVTFQPQAVPGGKVVVRQGPGGQPVTRTVVKPPATERCTERPNAVYWNQRSQDVLATIKHTARKIGLIQAIRIPDQYQTVTAKSERPAGWAAYAFAVPGKGNLKVTLAHPNEGWFRLLMADQWGGPIEGMFQNIIPKGYPTVSFHNPKEEAQVVFVIVDDPGWMSSATSLYTLAIDRDWAPGKLGPKAEYPKGGVWAVMEPKAGTRPPTAAEVETPSTQP
jgi:hypothetical protein